MPKFTCTCGKKYKFPPEFAGKKARCKDCREIFTLPAEEPEEDDGLFKIADDPTFDSEVAAAQERAQHQGEIVSGAAASAALPGAGVRIGDAVLEGDAKIGRRGYWEDVLWSFLFITNIKNLLIFLFLWVIFALLQIFGGGCFVVIFSIAIYGWWAGYRFETIASAASGQDDLPDLTEVGESFFDYAAALFKWLASWALVMFPGLIIMGVAFTQGALAADGSLDALLGGASGLIGMVTAGGLLGLGVVLCLLGIALWPIVALCFAIGGIGTIARIDLMVQTIMRTLPAYVALLAFIYGSTVLQGMFEAWANRKVMAGATMQNFMGRAILLNMGLAGIMVYVELVSCRLVGLYYHHFKKKFAWSWE